MDRKMQINVLVPDELKYTITPNDDFDSAPLFIAVKEKGQLLIKPLANYLTSYKPSRSEADYRNGYTQGVVDGYEDGYHRGFNDGDDHRPYDSRYKGSSWLSQEDCYDYSCCCRDCQNCPYFDHVFDVCRYEDSEMTEEDE